MPLRLLTALLLLTFQATAAEYSFTVNGETVHPKILPVTGERYGQPSAGDLAEIDHWRFVLPAPGHYDLQREDAPGGIRFVHQDSTVGFIAHDGNEPAYPPAGVITERLWGLVLHGSETKNNAIDSLIPDRCALTFHFERDLMIPVLPRHLQYLSIVAPEADLHNFGSVANLTKLRFLELKLPGSTDLRKVLTDKTTANLINLDIGGGRNFSFPDAPHLRFLKLRHSKSPLNPALLAKYTRLRVLKIDGTDIPDLRPIQPALGNLRLLSAHDSTLAHLAKPTADTPLRDLRIGNTPVLQNKELIAKYRAVASVSIKNWEPSIRAFERWDARNEIPEQPVLFIGSSSVRLWDLKGSFPDIPTLNRGFGGSELSDSLQYFDRIVLPYRPKVILLYAGDNDIGNTESAAQVISDYKAFAAKVRSKLPKTHFAYLPIKPSLARWQLWPEMKRTNEAIRKITEGDQHLHYLDTVTPMLGEDGKPRKEFFVDDGLHMNADGYEAWTAVVTPWLLSLD